MNTKSFIKSIAKLSLHSLLDLNEFAVDLTLRFYERSSLLSYVSTHAFVQMGMPKERAERLGDLLAGNALHNARCAMNELDILYRRLIDDEDLTNFFENYNRWVKKALDRHAENMDGVEEWLSATLQ